MNAGSGRSAKKAFPYTAPFIWIGAGKIRIERRTDRGNEKLFTYDKFKVRDISYNDSREIAGLTIMNQDGRIVYCLNGGGAARQPAAGEGEPEPGRNAGPSQEPGREAERMQEINRELERTGVALDAVLERYGVSSIQEMDSATYRRAIGSLKKTKAKAA